MGAGPGYGGPGYPQQGYGQAGYGMPYTAAPPDPTPRGGVTDRRLRHDPAGLLLRPRLLRHPVAVVLGFMGRKKVEGEPAGSSTATGSRSRA